MPELPEMQALSERLEEALGGARLESVEALGFSGLKTVRPAPAELLGEELSAVTRRGKYLVLAFARGFRLLVHLSQAGRLDLEAPPKVTRPRHSVVRLVFSGETALLVREYGNERKAGWWVLAPGDEGPLAALGPEPLDPAFAELLASSDDNRQIHTLLRDQRFVAGLGRGHTDDALHRARLSPFASLRKLGAEERLGLRDSILEILDAALARERSRSGGLSDAKLGDRFVVHNRAGSPCPQCGTSLQRVSFESHEVVYCSNCQTAGRVLADRRLSRLLR